jgi:hypothetical protein
LSEEKRQRRGKIEKRGESHAIGGQSPIIGRRRRKDSEVQTHRGHGDSEETVKAVNRTNDGFLISTRA